MVWYYFFKIWPDVFAYSAYYRENMNPFFIILLFIQIANSAPEGKGNISCPPKGIFSQAWSDLTKIADNYRGAVEGRLAKDFQELVVANIAADLSHSKRKLEIKTQGKIFELDLGKKLGGGAFGNVYEVKKISDPSLVLSSPAVPLVVKFPHTVKGISLGPPQITKAAILREAETSSLILKNLTLIESDPHFPKETFWEPGKLPLIPTIKMIDTDQGPLLFKPLLKKAKFINEISKLTPEMIKGLEDIYEMTQSIHRKLKINVGKKVEGFCLDIRPPNLAWIDDPEMLSALGFKRPGWVMFEMDQLTHNLAHYTNSNGFSFNQYLAEFRSYMKVE